MFGENTPGQIPGKPTQTETNNHQLRETRVPLGNWRAHREINPVPCYLTQIRGSLERKLYNQVGQGSSVESMSPRGGGKVPNKRTQLFSIEENSVAETFYSGCLEDLGSNRKWIGILHREQESSLPLIHRRHSNRFTIKRDDQDRPWRAADLWQNHLKVTERR